MKKITQLPFDLFSRHYIVANLVNKAFRKGNEKLTILDLGGYAGQTQHFFVKDKVTVLDTYDINNQANYIKGDATNLTFQDNSFDIVTNFDVFEHIPRELRHKFVTEALRVSKRAVILTFPVDHDSNKATSEAENTLDTFFKKLTGSRHPWLREHIDYGIPTAEEFEQLLNGIGAVFTKISSNSIVSWKLMQTLNFIGTVDELDNRAAKILNRQYNTHIESIENNIKNGYRAIYIICKDKKYQKPLKENVNELYKSPNTGNTINDIEFQKQALDSMIMLMAENMKRFKKTTNDYNRLLQKNREIEIQTQRLKNELIKLKESSSWRATAPLRVSKKVLNDIHKIMIRKRS